MHIDSVRALKTELFNSHVSPLENMKESGAHLAIAARAMAKLEKHPRTMALGVIRHGNDFRLAVRLQNSALASSPVLAAIRQQAREEVDVRVIGRVVKRAGPPTARHRPLAIGTSIGHFRITAGTLGCFVTMRSDGTPRILSNNHVLADENSGKPGDPVIQPGQIDGGIQPDDVVGALDAFVPLDPVGSNTVDCATATIAAGITFDSSTLPGVGVLTGLGPEIHDMGGQVAKTGRTTGATRGRVTAFELDNVIVGYDMGNVRFDGQIEIEGAGDDPFSRGGDSGSLIVDDAGGAVALLFAGGDMGGTNGMGLTYGNPIRTVLDALEVDLLV